MSPLARSLFALVAIFAVAFAQYWPDDNCDEEDFGEPGVPGVRDIELTNVTVQCPEGIVDINHWCEQRWSHMRTCGEHVRACNPDIYGPNPTIWVQPPGSINPVHVTCNDPDETEATVKITVHCCYY